MTSEQTLAETRSRSTDDERKVLALEAIADQLKLLVSVLNRGCDPILDESTSAKEGDLLAAGSWENEGGALIRETMNSLGIRHSVRDQFEIRGYRYSKLEDAIAEAKRGQAH